MKPTDDLFQLIKSLSKAEKRHFRMFSMLGGARVASRYMQLYDLLERMDDYDEGELRKSLPDEISRYLPQTKHYLYNNILKSLSLFHVVNSVDAQLDEMVQGAWVLHERGLHAQCRKLLQRARRLATAEERSHHMMRILMLEYRLAINEAVSENREEQLDRIFDEIIALGDTLALRMRFWRVQAKMFYRSRQIGEARSERDAAWCTELLNEPVMARIHETSDPATQLYYLFTHDHFLDILGRTEELCRWRRRIVHYIESVPVLKERLIDRYIPALYNFCIALINDRRGEEFATEYRKLSEAAARARHQTPGFSDLHIRALEPLAYSSRGCFSGGARLLEPIEEELVRQSNTLRIGFTTYLTYLCAYIRFGAGDYRQSLEWVNNILNAKRDIHENYHCFARILNLAVHYELGNFRSLESFIASAGRYLVRHERMFRFEETMIELMRKMIATPGGIAEKTMLKEYRDKFIALVDDPFESRVFNHFDAIAWIDAKIEGITFEDAARRRMDGEKGDLIPAVVPVGTGEF
jgi:hypothetical protein